MWNDSEFNSTFSSPNANAAKESKKFSVKHIVPVTAHTINMSTQVEGENTVFEYNHLTFSQVYFIGIIRNVIKRANDITYLVDDMTSKEVNVKLQSDDTDDMESEEARPPQSQFIENQYVKVFGLIKSLQGQKCVQAFKIVPVTELNELTHHLLECMNTSIYYTQKAAHGGGSTGGMEEMAVGGGDHHRNANASVNHAATATGGLSGLHFQVSNMIKQCKNSEGIHLKDICSYLKSTPESKIREALEFLSTEGHVYTTIDDNHFKSTESC